MNGRYQIVETTTFVQANDGWCQVTITDTLTGDEARGVAKTYAEAVQRAWQKLKRLEPTKAV